MQVRVLRRILNVKGRGGHPLLSDPTRMSIRDPDDCESLRWWRVIAAESSQGATFHRVSEADSDWQELQEFYGVDAAWSQDFSCLQMSDIGRDGLWNTCRRTS